MCLKTCFDHVLLTVEAVTEVYKDDILSKKRQEEIVDARCLFIYILHKHYGISKKRISNALGCTPSNVFYHVRCFESRKNQNFMFKTEYQIILQKLFNKQQVTI